MTLPAALSLDAAGQGADLEALIAAHDRNVDSLLYMFNGGMQLTNQMGARILAVQFVMPDTQWIDVASTIGFKNGWVNGSLAAAYKIDPTGRVYFRGIVTSGTIATGSTGTVFTLPTGYLPIGLHDFPVASNAAYGEARVLTSGDVRAAVGSNASFDLAPIQFQAAPPATAPRVFNAPGTRDISAVQGWPLTIRHGLKSKCQGVIPLSCGLISGSNGAPIVEGGASCPMPLLDMTPDDGRGNVLINSVFGLSPGKMYNLSLLAIIG